MFLYSTRDMLFKKGIGPASGKARDRAHGIHRITGYATNGETRFTSEEVNSPVNGHRVGRSIFNTWVTCGGHLLERNVTV